MLLRSVRAFVAACGLAVAGCGGAISSPDSNPLKTPLPAPTPVGLETPPAGTIYLGAYAFASKSASDMTTLEAQIGRKLAMDMHYYVWTGNFPGPPEAADAVLGRLPIDTWNCQLTNAQIAAGAGDLLITTRALAIKNFSHPVFLRYLADVNEPASAIPARSACYDPSTDNPDGTFSAAEFVLAWQHVRQIFNQEKVTNVIWVWSVSSAGKNPAPYYPGDAYVDWVGIDSYDSTGVGFVPTIAPIYALATVYHKPILISETATTAVYQPAFLQQAVPALKSQFPLISGLVYYDAKTSIDWRLTTGITAFTTLASDPYVSAFGSL